MAAKTVLHLLVCAALIKLAKDFLVHFVILYLGWDSPFLYILKFYSRPNKTKNYIASEHSRKETITVTKPIVRRHSVGPTYNELPKPPKATIVVKPPEISHQKEEKIIQEIAVTEVIEPVKIVHKRSPPKVWKDPTPFDTPPDSEECSSVTSSSPDASVSKRPRKNRKKKFTQGNALGRAEANLFPATPKPSTDIPLTFKDSSLGAIFGYVGLSEQEIFRKLLPMCANAETRILNGFPYETTQGEFVFKPYGYSSLNAALDGKQLVRAETQDICVEHEDGHQLKYSPKKPQKIPSTETPQVSLETLNLNCSRCQKNFNVKTNGSCSFHPGKIGIRSDGFMRYDCCNGIKNNDACHSNSYHVFHHLITGLNGPLVGFISAKNKKRPSQVFGLDCEMVFTDQGFEVGRVTIVNVRGVTIFDAYVKHVGKLYDYNTKYSGITGSHMNGAMSFKHLQKMLLQHIGQSDILVGHSIEADLVVLKLIHRRVLDTSILFPSVNNCKQSLKKLSKQYLDKDIQQSSGGHNSIEDACIAVSLVLQSLIPNRQRQDQTV